MFNFFLVFIRKLAILVTLPFNRCMSGLYLS